LNDRVLAYRILDKKTIKPNCKTDNIKHREKNYEKEKNKLLQQNG